MLREPEGPVWLDGKRIPATEAVISLFDPAVQRGIGLFETLAVRGGTCLDLELHLARMESGARALALEQPSRDRLLDAIGSICAQTPDPGWLKIVLTGGSHLAVYGGGMEASEERAPCSAALLPWRRSVDDPYIRFKTVNYAASMAGLAWAKARGADEGLWLNTRGHLAEACTSNVFLVRRGRLFTPGEGDGILPGTVRRRVFEAAKGLGVHVHEGRVRVPRLAAADEVFLSSSLRGLRPVLAVDGRPVGTGRPGAWTAKLGDEVDRLRRAASGTHIE